MATSQVIRKTFIIRKSSGSFMRDYNKARDHGWKVLWSGDGMICFVKYYK